MKIQNFTFLAPQNFGEKSFIWIFLFKKPLLIEAKVESSNTEICRLVIEFFVQNYTFMLSCTEAQCESYVGPIFL